MQPPNQSYSQHPSVWEWLNPFSRYNRQLQQELDDLILGRAEPEYIDVPARQVKPTPQENWSCHQWLIWLKQDPEYLARVHGFKPIDWKVVDKNLYFLNHDRRAAIVTGLTIKGLNQDGYFGDDSPHMEFEWVE